MDTDDVRSALSPQVQKTATEAAEFLLTYQRDKDIGRDPVYVSANFPLDLRGEFVPFHIGLDEIGDLSNGSEVVRQSNSKQRSLKYVLFDVYSLGPKGLIALNVVEGKTVPVEDPKAPVAKNLHEYVAHDDVDSRFYIRREKGRLRIYRMSTLMID